MTSTTTTELLVHEETDPKIPQILVSRNSESSIRIRAAGPGSDPSVCANWMSMWREVGMDHQSHFVPDYEGKTLDFIGRAREKLSYQTFLAEDDDGNVVGSASCQVWTGPQPTSTAVAASGGAKIGTMWAVFVKPEHRRKGVASRLVEHCIEHWRTTGCSRAVLLFASEEGRRVYERLGFRPGPMLAHDTSESDRLFDNQDGGEVLRTETGQYKIVEEPRTEFDLLWADHFRRCVVVSGEDPLSFYPDVIADTTKFIKDARKRLGFRAFAAYGESGEVVGSVCCQVWEGPFPMVLTESALKFGSIWGLYLRPETVQSELIGAALLKRCVGYLKSIGCHKVITLCPNEKTEAIFKNHASFHSSNAMTLDINADHHVLDNIHDCTLAEGATRQMVDQLRCFPGVSHMSDRQLGWLTTANHNQLQALDIEEEIKVEVVRLQKESGTFVDPKDNWFTHNVTKLGRGFDLKKLSESPTLLAEKFDRLAPKYNEWTLGNRSKVESWVVEMNSRLQQLPVTTHIFDICCGTGLMGQLLRICGFRGVLSGFDISPGMLGVARRRRCYDYLQTADANRGFSFPRGTADVILCSGAMELLEVGPVINEFARLLKKGGELWVSFQADTGEGNSSSTSHQNVEGITREELERVLEMSNFDLVLIELCPDAFWTPSPLLDGTLLPVPYYFVCCMRS